MASKRGRGERIGRIGGLAAGGQADGTEAFGALLERELGCAVLLRFGRSRRHPVVARSPTARERRADPRLGGGALVVRLHALFGGAPEPVRLDLARWLRHGGRARAASARLWRWMEAALDALPPAPERPLRIVTAGRVHDLARITRELVATELAADFEERALPAVTWGERRLTGAKRSLRLGTYEHARDLVRIHAVLDQEGVPELFVRSVLFHEFLHALVPARQDAAGRWIHHPPEFRRRERARPEHAAAVAWERRHVTALLRSTATGLDMPLR